MTVAETMRPTGSLATLMDELCALEETVHPDLRPYRWQPYAAQLPAIWNWIGPSSFTVMDIQRWRDTVTINAQIGIAHTDPEQDMSQIGVYADRFRDVIDDALYNRPPINGAAIRAARTGMQMAALSLNGVELLVVQFPLVFDLDRHIQANQ